MFLHVTLVLPYSKKTFLTWTERSGSKRWLIKYAWLFQSIGGLQQLFCQCFTNKCCQKYEFYHRKGYRKSNAIHITAIMSSWLWQPLYPLFSYCSTLYGHEVMFRCCNDLSYIFIHTYVCISTVKHPKQKMIQQIVEPVVNLPLRHYCMMILLVLLGFDASSSDYLAKRLTHLLVKPTEWVAGVLLTETVTYAWSVSTSLQSTLFKPKTFFTIW